MKWHLLLLVLLLLPFGVAAQEEDWPVIERCIGEFNYPSVPPSRWDFEGIIVSTNHEGVRAIKSTEPQQYFIALESGNSFPEAGTFSPDGRWFAWPVGESEYANMTSYYYSIDAIAVVSTDLRESMRIPWNYYGYHSSSQTIANVAWLSPDQFTFETRMGPDQIAHLPSGETSDWEIDKDIDVVFPNVSPDGTRLVVTNYGDDDFVLYLIDSSTGRRLAELGSGMFPLWLPDSSAFIRVDVSSKTSYPRVALYDSNGTLIGAFPNLMRAGLVLSPDGRKVAFEGANYRIYYADLEANTIYDTCLDRRGGGGIENNIAWSPDSSTIAFTYDGFPILLNVETMEHIVLRYETGEIITWLPEAD
jgi:WD40 repeat protein